MKKLFLTSSAAKVLPLLPGFLSTDVSHMSVAFIPTAADPYGDKYFVEDDKKALIDLWFHIVLVDVKNDETAVITQKLQSADIIFVAGGNTFYLLQELQRKWIDKVIVQLVNEGKLYIWSSAWSVVAGPNIEIVQDIDKPNEAPELTSFVWLHLIESAVLPHCDSLKYQAETEKILKKYSNYQHPIIKLGDYQAVYIDWDHMTLVENTH